MEAAARRIAQGNDLHQHLLAVLREDLGVALRGQVAGAPGASADELQAAAAAVAAAVVRHPSHDLGVLGGHYAASLVVMAIHLAGVALRGQAAQATSTHEAKAVGLAVVVSTRTAY